jgi:hypothetical protein
MTSKRPGARADSRRRSFPKNWSMVGFFSGFARLKFNHSILAIFGFSVLPHFSKGGRGGICSLTVVKIPLYPPFSKGEFKKTDNLLFFK